MAAPRPKTSPGRAATRADGERSRERILDAAEQLLAERGYAATGIAAISRESGLPASSIYWFFESKQEIAAAVFERAADRWLAELGAEPLEGPPAERLRRLFSRGIEQTGEQLPPPFVRLQILLSLELGDSDPQIMERLRRVQRRGQQRVTKALEGLFEELGSDAVALAAELSPLVMGFAQGAMLARRLDPSRIDLDRLVGDLEVAMLAVARLRLAQEGERVEAAGGAA